MRCALCAVRCTLCAVRCALCCAPQIAANQARREHDPYYIKSGSSKAGASGSGSGSGASAAGSGGVSQADLDSIPMRALSGDEFGGASVSVKKGGKKGKNEDEDEFAAAAPAKSYTVISVEDMPKGKANCYLLALPRLW